MVVVDGGTADLQRLGAGDSDDVADPAAILVLPRAALAIVVIVGNPRRPYMGRDVALVVVQRAAQALAVDQAVVELTGQGLAHILAHVVLIGFAVEDQ